MVGVGTGNVDLDAFQYSFCSLLGRDGESWGLSYYGKAHHKGQFANFRNARFGQGSILGLHLDMWQGTLSYYKNRQPLGKLRTFSFLASYLHLLLYCTSLCQCLIHNSTPHSCFSWHLAAIAAISMLLYSLSAVFFTFLYRWNSQWPFVGKTGKMKCFKNSVERT